MACYLVTGGAGFIGSHLVDALIGRGHSVRVLDDLSSGKIDNLPSGTELIRGDVTESQTVRRGLDGVDGCFHLAAIASVERSRREWLRTHQVNVGGTVTVLEEIRRAQLRCGSKLPVVYASSAAVYGDAAATPTTEQSCPMPLTAYGVDKLSSELHAAVAGRVHGIPTAGLRLFNVYGPRQDPSSPYSGVVSIFTERLLQGAPIDVFGDGEQTRDFVFVADVVDAMCRAIGAASTAAPVTNVCTGTGTTIRTLATTIAALCGTECTIQQHPQRNGDLRLSIGDPSRAHDQLGFTARVPLATGLAETFAEARCRPTAPEPAAVR